MEKEEALNVAIELAKFSLTNATFVVDSTSNEKESVIAKTGKDVADFIETLTERLTKI